MEIISEQEEQRLFNSLPKILKTEVKAHRAAVANANDMKRSGQITDAQLAAFFTLMYLARIGPRPL